VDELLRPLLLRGVGRIFRDKAPIEEQRLFQTASGAMRVRDVVEEHGGCVDLVRLRKLGDGAVEVAKVVQVQTAFGVSLGFAKAVGSNRRSLAGDRHR
jgi:hypothetical protein